MEKMVTGVFKTEEAAIRAVKSLKTNGYANDEISVLAKQGKKLKNIKDETDVNIEKKRADGTGGAVGGAVAGGALGGAGALLLELGVLTIPGVGPFLAVGPIVATLAGIVAGGAIGGVYAALVDLGFSKTDAKVYGGYLDQGNILVLVDEKDCRDAVCDSFRENDCLNKDMLI